MLEPHCTFFNSYVCHVCKNFETPLKRCSSCKTVSYCSTEHQKSDWKIHKEICRVIKDSRSVHHSSVNTFQDLLIVQFQKYNYWKENLKRDLYDYEMQMWMFPRYCPVCYSQETILCCEKCHSSSYCSEYHKVHHEHQHNKHCDELKLILEMELIFFQEENKNSFDLSVKDIQDNIGKLPENLKQLMSCYDNNYTSDDEFKWQISKMDSIAPVATILYGLESGKFLNDRVLSKEEFVVHLVGADLMEMGLLWKYMSELPFHWMKNLKSFEYIIIGPNLHHTGTTDKFTHQLCDSCKSKNCTTRITFHEQLYHNILHFLKKPDVVVALNSGLHEFLGESEEKDTWQESIPFLCQHPGVPLILTAYTQEEIIADVNRVKTAVENVRVLVEHHRNPFSNMKPLRNFASDTEPIYYLNGYVTVLMKNYV